jgi:flagellar basal-body rod protein FlgF
MDRLIYTSLGAATSQEFNRTQLTNDLANLSTTGYKRANLTTTEAAFLKGPGHPTRFQPIVMSQVEHVNLEPGPIAYTGNDLDIAMNNQTVLGVQTEDGNIAFTRRGDLRVTSTGIVETGTGHIVMAEGAPLTIPQGYLITISPDGSVFGTDANVQDAEPVLVGQLMLRDASAVQLTRRTDTLYEVQGSNGNGGNFPSGPAAASVSPGALEGSNVNPVEVMVSLLDLYRSFEMQMKVIKSSEEIDKDGARMMSLR